MSADEPDANASVWRDRQTDLLAGATVTLVGIPQCLAYSMVAGLPPAYGLTTAAVPGLVAALYGKSAQVVTGPTNTTALLIFAALTPFMAANGDLGPQGLTAVATLCVLAGVIRLIAVQLGGASVIRFLPASVLAGFTAGVGVLIGAMQLDEAVGLSAISAAGLYGEVKGISAQLGADHYPSAITVVVTVTTIALIGVGRRYKPRLPVALLTVSLAGIIAWLFDLDAQSGLRLVRDRSPVPSGWPPGGLPSLDIDLISQLITPAAAMALIGTLELTVSANAAGQRPDLNREIRAQGWANIAGAFTSAFPASVSLTRSALVRMGGARSRFAAGAAAVVVVPILLFAGDAVGYIPQASLAGVLLITAAGMIDRRRLIRIWRASRTTGMLLTTTIVATLTLPLELSVLVGAGLGLIVHIAMSSRPRIQFFRPTEGTLIPLPDGAHPKTLVVEVSGNLHYAAAVAALDTLDTRLPQSATTIIIDLSHAHHARFTALLALEELESALGRRQVTLHLAGVSKDFAAVLERAESRLKVTLHDPLPGASVAHCLAAINHDA